MTLTSGEDGAAYRKIDQAHYSRSPSFFFRVERDGPMVGRNEVGHADLRPVVEGGRSRFDDAVAEAAL
jgi:hypothetical protein